MLDIVVGLVVLPMLVVDMWALFWWTESLKRNRGVRSWNAKMVSEWVKLSGIERDKDTLWRLYWQRRMEDPNVTLSDCLALHPEPAHHQERS